MRMRMRKKQMLSWILTLAMVIGCFASTGVTAKAADPTVTKVSVTPDPVKEGETLTVKVEGTDLTKENIWYMLEYRDADGAFYSKVGQSVNHAEIKDGLSATNAEFDVVIPANALTTSNKDKSWRIEVKAKNTTAYTSEFSGNSTLAKNMAGFQVESAGGEAPTEPEISTVSVEPNQVTEGEAINVTVTGSNLNTLRYSLQYKYEVFDGRTTYTSYNVDEDYFVEAGDDKTKVTFTVDIKSIPEEAFVNEQRVTDWNIRVIPSETKVDWTNQEVKNKLKNATFTIKPNEQPVQSEIAKITTQPNPVKSGETLNVSVEGTNLSSLWYKLQYQKDEEYLDYAEKAEKQVTEGVEGTSANFNVTIPQDALTKSNYNPNWRIVVAASEKEPTSWTAGKTVSSADFKVLTATGEETKSPIISGVSASESVREDETLSVTVTGTDLRTLWYILQYKQSEGVYTDVDYSAKSVEAVSPISSTFDITIPENALTISGGEANWRVQVIASEEEPDSWATGESQNNTADFTVLEGIKPEITKVTVDLPEVEAGRSVTVTVEGTDLGTLWYKLQYQHETTSIEYWDYNNTGSSTEAKPVQDLEAGKKKSFSVTIPEDALTKSGGEANWRIQVIAAKSKPYSGWEKAPNLKNAAEFTVLTGSGGGSTLPEITEVTVEPEEVEAGKDITVSVKGTNLTILQYMLQYQTDGETYKNASQKATEVKNTDKEKKTFSVTVPKDALSKSANWRIQVISSEEPPSIIGGWATEQNLQNAGTFTVIRNEELETEQAKAELQDLVTEAQELNESDYTAESWKVLQDELAKAEAASEDTSATAETLQAAKDELQAAMDGLVGKAQQEKTEIADLKKEAETLKESDYTAESWKELQDELAKANAVLQNENATAQELQTAKEALQAAMKKLVKSSVQAAGSKVNVSSISVTAISKKLAAGKKVPFTALVLPANAANKGVAWRSSNTKYATVDANGVVSLKKAGAGKKVTITATALDGSGKSGSITVKIMKNAVKKITLKAKKSVKAGKSFKVKVIEKTTGKKVNKKLKWTSSNPKYATVSKSGKVKTYKAGKGKTVKITAMATDGSNKKKTVKIKIK